MASDYNEKKPLVLLTAGGTGGHLFPAEALAVALQKKGIIVDLATDCRVAHFKFPARALHVIPSATLTGGGLLPLARTVSLLALGTFKAYTLIRRIKPNIVVGFGGYPTVPPIFAAILRGVPTLVHEQNGVIGRANRLMASLVKAIGTGFPNLKNLPPSLRAKTTFIGNPVRPQVVVAAATPYAAPKSDGRINLLVFGGSQGAHVMAEIVPAAIESLDAALRARLSIVQQARAEDLEFVRATYARLGIAAECAPFFADLPQRMATAHLVISRSGASTVAELAAIGRPAILVPLPHALDQDQLANAGVLQVTGGAIMIIQRDFTADRLAAEIDTLAAAPQRLVRMAMETKSAGTLDATEKLAELVVRIAGI
jgi:UDP-N-acetylglucosamine--N-acetylmuramyl-(pentapeptide) pyrophosphoryl-undecaprenol N-acetylglucosamine transferase